MWQKTDGGEMTWEDAQTYAANLSLGDYEDWRLPNIKELRSINNESMFNPSVDASSFPNIKSELYWSSTTEVNQTQKAWFVNFEDGLVSHEEKSQSLNVLCVRTSTENVTDIGDDSINVPSTFKLEQNYPNPFNPTTTIAFSLPVAEKITLTIYNAPGQKVAVLADENYSAGNFTLKWDAGAFASGIYIFTLQTTSQFLTRKMVLLK